VYIYICIYILQYIHTIFYNMFLYVYICIYSNIIYYTFSYTDLTRISDLSLKFISSIHIYGSWIGLASSSFSSSSCRTEFIFKSRCCCPHCLELDQWRWRKKSEMGVSYGFPELKDAVLTFWKLCTIISSSNFSMGVAFNIEVCSKSMVLEISSSAWQAAARPPFPALIYWKWGHQKGDINLRWVVWHRHKDWKCWDPKGPKGPKFNKFYGLMEPVGVPRHSASVSAIADWRSPVVDVWADVAPSKQRAANETWLSLTRHGCSDVV